MTADAGVVLGIDIGSSSVKAAAFSRGDDWLRVAARTTVIPSNPFRAGELDPHDVWDVCQRTLSELTKKVGSHRVCAIGITGMAEAGCLIDRNGQPTTPILLWHDRRGVKQVADWKAELADRFAGIGGIALTHVRSAAKLAWLIKEGAASGSRWCGVPEWVMFRLTGAWLTEPSLAIRTGLYDVRRASYSGELLTATGLPRSALAPIRLGAAARRPLLPGLAGRLDLRTGTTATIAGHDDIVAAVGLRLDEQQLADSSGTAEALIQRSARLPDPLSVVRAGGALAPYPTGGWAVISGVGTTGALLSEVSRRLGRSIADLDRLVSPPHSYPRGTLKARLSPGQLPTIAIDPTATASEVWSATLDQIAERFARSARRLRPLLGPPQLVVFTGGAASRELVRRKAQTVGGKSQRTPDRYITTLGAARIAASD